jgi:hypothetical protein
LQKKGAANLTRSTVNDYIESMLRAAFILCCLIWPFFSPQTCLAFEIKGQDCSKCHTLNQTEATDLLKNLFPDIIVLNISMSPSKGLWEVYGQSGGRKGIFYVDFAKKHAFLGSMISIAEKKNLSQERMSELNKVDVSQIPLQDALVMGNPNAKFKVIVFDDPD